MKSINLKYSIKEKLLLRLNRIFINLKIKKSWPFLEITINEKHKSKISVAKYLITAISLLSAYFAFQSTHIAFLFALGIYLLSLFFEKIIFHYTVLYISPLPDFELVPEKWLGAFFGYAKDKENPDDIPLVGILFDDEDYAKKIHSLLLSWTCNNLVDEEKNISVSVIIEGKNSYSIFIYPNPFRKPAEEFFKRAEKEIKESSPQKMPRRLYVFQTMGRQFDISEESYLFTFMKRYREGVPYLFQVALREKDGNIKQIEGLEYFVLFNLKIKNKKDLDRKDVEYDMYRLID